MRIHFYFALNPDLAVGLNENFLGGAGGTSKKTFPGKFRGKKSPFRTDLVWRSMLAVRSPGIAFNVLG